MYVQILIFVQSPLRPAAMNSNLFLFLEAAAAFFQAGQVLVCQQDASGGSDETLAAWAEGGAPVRVERP